MDVFAANFDGWVVCGRSCYRSLPSPCPSPVTGGNPAGQPGEGTYMDATVTIRKLTPCSEPLLVVE